MAFKTKLKYKKYPNMSKFNKIFISDEKVAEIAEKFYDLKGQIVNMPGESDLNFRITDKKKNSYILKICRPGTEKNFIDFQQKLLEHLEGIDDIISPKVFPDTEGNKFPVYVDINGEERFLRLLSWIPGRIWSGVNPHNQGLLSSLGKQCGNMVKALSGFDHLYAHRDFEWDLAQAEWTYNSLKYFTVEEAQIVVYFQNLYDNILPNYKTLKKGVIQNDANDNNIIVSEDLENPEVTAVIDFGDAIHTPVINELAVAIAYAVMNKPDSLEASLHIVKAFNSVVRLEEEDISCLYTLVGMRLVISVCKSAINKKNEPENEYLLISEKSAWELLIKWKNISEKLAYYSFRDACGFYASPDYDKFKLWSSEQNINMKEMFPEVDTDKVFKVDLSVGSVFIGNLEEYNDLKLSEIKFEILRAKHRGKIVCGGYSEARPFYSTDTFRKERNNGPAYRTVHLGTDYWLPDRTAVHAPLNAVVHSIHNNDNDKDYGHTLILKHKTDEEFCFYTLYGHLSKDSLNILQENQEIKQGELIAYIGNRYDNGGWVPHLHFQVMLDMLDYKTDFPGVAYPDEINVWSSLCPNPNLLFKNSELEDEPDFNKSEIKSFRDNHLGKSLSLSYKEPLTILRGDKQYLINSNGRRYLDTVNNVAHVGHEHPRVVKAGQNQMAVLNTNTRYLHNNIVEFADELLKVLPEELSVIHFVNSGSEANELAMRMAKAYTKQKDIIALEIGYHGNTGGCIDISSYKFDGEGGAGAPENTHIVPLPDSFRGKHRGELWETGELYANYIKEKIDIIKNKGRGTAAFIAESIVSCGGQIELPDDYLKLAYEYVREAGGVCIADEVQIGFGRTGEKFWGFELHNVVPDILTMGKPIGNGHPLAVVACTKEIAEAFANGMEYFNTFGGNPVSCAIGKEVLKVIKDENLQKNALKIGNYLKEELNMLKEKYHIIGDVRGKGLFLGFELNQTENLEPLSSKAEYLANRMKDFGILMSTDGPDCNVLKIKPPMCFSKENADELIKRLSLVFEEDFMVS